MSDQLQVLRATFRDEARDVLADLEQCLLDLEHTPADPELIDRAFRTLHTIKGSAGMCGYDITSRYAHELESVFDLVRGGTLQVDQQLIVQTLAARDLVLQLVESDEADAHQEQVAASIAVLQQLAAGALPEGATLAAGAAAGAPPPPAAKPSGLTTYRIRFQPPPQVFLTGTDPALLLAELRELAAGENDYEAVCDTHELPSIEEIEPERCYLGWDIVITSRESRETIHDVFVFVEHESDLSIEVVDSPEEEEDLRYKSVGEILVDRGQITEHDVQTTLAEHAPVGRKLVDAGLVTEEQVESALVEQRHVRSTRRQRQDQAPTATVRVQSAKLDRLVDLVGELVTAQATIAQLANNHQQLRFASEQLERLAANLRDNTMSLRMVEIGSTYGRLRRLVYDLARELGKQVELQTEGGQTELDKTVIERVQDPLLHLLRNSIDHGLETPQQRVATGKPEAGRITISASHSGANVLITVEDDGGGFDVDAIRNKAVERGLLAEDARLSEHETLQLVFVPGFSTASQVTKVSGRGVGMDVVKRAIETLGGRVELSSKAGVGTRVTLQLPLTLAIIDGLLVQLADRYFVVPLGSVEECMELADVELETLARQSVARVRGEPLQVVRLRESFAVDGETEATGSNGHGAVANLGEVQPASAAPAREGEQLVVARGGGRRVGLVVDSVIGDQQVVIKSLGRIYRDLPGISGATILGDGSVGLVLDVQRLIA